MNRRIKSNLVLILTLIVAGIAALVLAVLTAVEHRKFAKNHNLLIQLTKTINDLNSQVPAPMLENKEPMQADLDFYKKLQQDFQYKFGTPLQAALGKFLATLKTVDGETLDEETFRRKFRNGWNEDGQGWDARAANEAGRNYYLTTFKNRFKNWNAAADAFRKEAETRTTEPLSNVDAMVFRLIGVNIPMSAAQIDVFNLASSHAVLRTVQGKMLVPDHVRFFGMRTGAEINADDAALVPFHWDVIGDLVRRMGASSILELDDFKIRKLQGESVGNLRKYHYTFTVLGTMKMIRDLCAAIDGAGADNRFYLVQSVFLYAHDDPVADLLKVKEENAEKNSPTVVHRKAAAGQTAGDGKDEKKEAEGAVEKTREEGSVAIGADDCVYAVIDVEYMVWSRK